MKRPLFDVGFSVLLGSAVVLYVGGSSWFLLPVLLVAALFCSAKASVPGWRRAAVCALSASASILLMLFVSISLESTLRPLDGAEARAVGVVTEKKSGNLYEVYGSVSGGSGSAEHIKFTLWTAEADELEAGDSFQCDVKVTYDDPFTSEYRSSAGESRFLFCVSRGEIQRLPESVSPVRAGAARLRAEVSQGFLHQMGTEIGALYSAVTTGLRPGFSEQVQTMKDAGVYHVLAISGLHISIFCHIVLGAVRVLPLRRRTRSALALLFLWCPVLLSGGSHAVLRAAVMYSVLLFGQVIGRKADSLNSLGLAVILLICMDPFAVLSYGFLLTVLATLGILLFERPLAEFLIRCLGTDRIGRLETGVIHLICCGLSAQALTVPILADMESRLVLNGVLAGVVILPLMTPMLLLGYLLVPLLLFAPAGVTGLLAAPAVLLGKVFLALAELFSGLPFIIPLCTPASRGAVILIEILLVALAAVPRLRRFSAPLLMAGVSLCCVLIAWEQWTLDGAIQVISRGEDLLLVRDNCAVLLLADRDSEMLEELRRSGVSRIDLLIVEDYAPLQSEGALELLREYPPAHIAAPEEGAVRSYLDAVFSGPVSGHDQVQAQLSGGIELSYQRGVGAEVSCGDILLLKFYDVYDIINQYEPDILLLPDKAARIRSTDGIRVRENSEERTELIIWPEEG